ncbi:MAG: NTP transferase domain-containing protein [Gemmatimonadetes bacterium]|nr:NTP transferase domain-containing protein [Gemmatimonadota bacterium]NIQ57377.1 NTP transferase domain-containing protein [Gemmatimonadota bacterium]NIU77541.1 NTP transferase domain-containing protein [Gammaproteobacteria bacterium]NIX47589.1 NTP transferase domain-containing protein [Gemmatimonadota bacterium]NIY11092.1 NTP transferase domain-containing protein [Gemmatimonadota bacterium]
MDGMILAAGLGTRLRPLTDRVPKALVPVAGLPMLERIAHRLIEAGVDRLIINVHHHADQIRTFVDDRQGFGVDTRLVFEPGSPLETGGGLLNARDRFRRDAPFFLHNVDIICDVDLAAMYRAHPADALATLAVNDRDSRRLLRFDEEGLQARVDPETGAVEAERGPRGEARDVAFAGIHVISPTIFDLVEERGAFSIIGPYLRLAGAGHRILPYDIGAALWLEVGDPDRLDRARRFMQRTNGQGER